MNEYDIIKLFRSGLDKYQVAERYRKYLKRYKKKNITKTEALAFVEPIIYCEVMSWNKSTEQFAKWLHFYKGKQRKYN